MTRSVEIRYEVTPALLREFLDCDPEAGKLFWKERARWWFTTESAWKIWNKRFAGKETFASISGAGYLTASVFNRTHTAHRVIWALVHGRWPTCLDHINGVRGDNRIENLREASQEENMKNQKLYSTNTSGALGVSFCLGRDKWQANTRRNGKRYFLGRHATPELAAAAYRYVARRTETPERHGEGGLLGDTGLLRDDPDLRAKLDRKVAEMRDE